MWMGQSLMAAVVFWWGFWNANFAAWTAPRFAWALLVPSLFLVRAHILVGPAPDSVGSFRDHFFANRVPFYGVVVACLDHPNVQDILPRIDKRMVTYGFSAQADYRARNPVFSGLSVGFDVEHRGGSLGQFEVRMPGAHNVLNAQSC